ncbi:hypothetical protein EDD21DRAFT_388134 [Dissophora ornata]|nr:hypothetical protein EDD21DRAFT_388134 [Dissophora ornata]
MARGQRELRNDLITSFFRIAQSAECNETDPADMQMWVEAWTCILNGLADEWPLVREAFQEQLVKGISQSDKLKHAIQQPSFMDQIMEEPPKLENLAQDRMKIAAGILVLANLAMGKEDGIVSELSATNAWDIKRVNAIVGWVMEGWIISEATQRTRICELLANSFTGTLMVQALGSLTTFQFPQSPQDGAEFSQVVLRQLSKKHEEQKRATVLTSQAPAVPAIKDWALVLWLCDQLRIPSVFASESSLQDSKEGRATADKFIRTVPTLLECIGHVLEIQSVDNTYTLHRVIIACAAFTNSKDIWNRLHHSISNKTKDLAHENLKTIYQSTPWSASTVSNAPFNATPSSTSKDDRKNIVMIPGTFSDHIIQILEREIRPSFTHAKAQKVTDRAQTTITLHQERMRQPIQMIEESSPTPSAEIVSISNNKDIARQQQQQRPASSQRFKIAPVTDTPNDEEEIWTALDNEPSNSATTATSSPSSLIPRKWNTNFLESVPVAEWCAQQPIQDPSRIHEVFMILVTPILAMTDAPERQYRIRGLDLLTRFLIQYHNQGYPSSSSVTSAAQRRRQENLRVWIKIFERTGLDQVLERSLKPLLGPLQMGIASTASAAIGGPEDDSGSETIQAAFRAYLTLVLVNTEPSDRPASVTDRHNAASSPSSVNGSNTRAAAGQSDSNALTVENLFLHGILASYRKANPTKEYRTLILGWLKILVAPVISFDFIREQMQMPHRRQGPLSVVPQNGDEDVSTLQEQQDQMQQQGEHFQGIFGVGSTTIKYLPTLVEHTCNLLEIPLPSSPVDVRQESLKLANAAADALRAIMEVSRPRVPRYRGKIMSAVASCWANSRIFSLLDLKTSMPPTASVAKGPLSQEQARLDQSLISTMQLCIKICQPKIIASDSVGTTAASSGLEMDLKVLRELDPSVFEPLFALE